MTHFHVFFRLTLISSAALALFACDNPSGSVSPIVIDESRYERANGPDCDQPDTLRSQCAQIKLAWPVLESGSETLRTNFAEWAETYLAGILAFGEDAEAPQSIEPAAESFLNAHSEFLGENEGEVMGLWTAESNYAIRLNDGQHLTAQLESYVYAGGAHGMPHAQVATFDARTGKILDWDDLVTDKNALRALAEKAFRTERAEAFNEGFEFDETFVFDLPINFGLTETGLLFHYNAYEVGPYALGSTEFVIPFSELGNLAKIKKR